MLGSYSGLFPIKIQLTELNKFVLNYWKIGINMKKLLVLLSFICVYTEANWRQFLVQEAVTSGRAVRMVAHHAFGYRALSSSSAVMALRRQDGSMSMRPELGLPEFSAPQRGAHTRAAHTITPPLSYDPGRDMYYYTEKVLDPTPVTIESYDGRVVQQVSNSSCEKSGRQQSALGIEDLKRTTFRIKKK
ncbi:MAG: hypothetical protein CMM87_02075 [Rickettsiales bacterium]|nr:hypothetical protein [Rickettsiales bacterium]|tara:strand:- start:1556 stop:2122 length:567 start_codon:yes stop_codon:yes gene_type:complete